MIFFFTFSAVIGKYRPILVKAKEPSPKAVTGD
jgi:hypothetical protein